MLRHFYTSSGKFVYFFSNLRVVDPPCSPSKSAISRWFRRANGCAATTTSATVIDALRAASGVLIRDITVTCAGVSAGAKAVVDGACWEHVHSDLHTVYNATYWASAHDGNKDAAKAGRPNPIAT